MSGLNRSYDHLKRMGLRVLELSLGDMANYADRVMVVNVNERWVSEQVLLTEFDIDDLVKMNATSFGNLAYVAVNSADKKVREKAVQLINEAKKLRELIS